MPNDIGNGLNVIAGPCSVENHEQVTKTAYELAQIGIRVYRAGLWKPRSNYGTFEGVGDKGIAWLQEIQEKYEMEVMTEVILPSHVEKALKAGIDMLWIGARTSVNPFMISELTQALAGVDIPIFIKNPMCPDINLWEGCIDRFYHAGIKNLSVIHRGFCLEYNSPYRNKPLWNLAEQLRLDFPEIPIYCDPSHISGNKTLIPEICTKAKELSYDGLFIEVHYQPEQALTDARQQITPCELKTLLHSI